MTIELLKRYRQNILVVAMLLMVLPVSGCFSLRNPFASVAAKKSTKALEVVALRNTEALQLTADDIVNIMLEVGFTPEQVMDIGGDLREALMFKGLARIRYNGEWVAQMRVKSERIQIFSTHMGYFEYDVKTQQWTVGPRASAALQQQKQTQQAQPEAPVETPVAAPAQPDPAPVTTQGLPAAFPQ